MSSTLELTLGAGVSGVPKLESRRTQAKRRHDSQERHVPTSLPERDSSQKVLEHFGSWDEFQRFVESKARQVVKHGPPHGMDLSDVEQEAMREALEKLPRFKGDSAGQVRKYLQVVVQNRIRNLLRTKQKENVSLDVASDNHPLAERLARRERRPSQCVRLKELTERLSRMHELLSQKELFIVTQCELGSSDNEIAEQLGLSAGRVRKLRCQAKMKLRDALKKMGYSVRGSTVG